MKVRSAVLATGTVLATVLLAGTGLVQAQAPAPGGAIAQPSTGPQGRMMGSRMMDESQANAMMARREQMMADMRATEKKLDDLLAQMDKARSNDKVNAIANVVHELVAQRNQMRDGMMSMQTDMMRHMMEHMQMGSQTMDACPMMKSLDPPGKD